MAELHTITPYFTVDGADRLIAFLETVFGARVVRDIRHPDNRVLHVRLQIGDSIMMLNDSSEESPTNVSQIHLFVDDADEAYERALKHGATSLMEPNVRPHGDRMAGIKDPFGNMWWLATPAS